MKEGMRQVSTRRDRGDGTMNDALGDGGADASESQAPPIASNLGNNSFNIHTFFFFFKTPSTIEEA